MDLPNIHVNAKSATARRWAEVQKRVKTSIINDKDDVRIVASTRGLMADPVLEACEAGVTEFCEDYLPEGITKKPVIAHRFPLTTWHFTGTLAPNKLHLAVEFFEWIHTFDRETLLKPLAEACAKHSNRKPKILIEVNPIGSQKKAGVPLKDVVSLCDSLSKIPNVELMGLSCRSELMMSASMAMKAYEMTAQEHQKLLKEGVLPATANVLAMGSSRDLEKAVGLGANLIRVGSALFGQSAPSKALQPVDEF